MTDKTISVIELFPCPLFNTVYPQGFQLEKKLLPLFENIANNDKNPYKYTVDAYTNYSTTVNIINDFEELKDLKNFLLKTIQDINHECQITGNAFIENSWFSINKKFSYHGLHNHLPSVWSGVYYVSADKKDATITFEDRNKNSHWPWYCDYKHVYTMREINIAPETGKLLIFPAYLHHRVDQQLQDSARVTISFNVNME